MEVYISRLTRMVDNILISGICGISKLVKREPIPLKGILSKLEEIKKTELYAVIVDRIGTPVSHKGSLGMNFLSRLDYRIDFERRVIIWK